MKPSQVPEGKEWVRREDGTFELHDKVVSQSPELAVDIIEEPGPEGAYIFHTLNRDLDTLEGLCLRYNISRRDLQKVNTFSGSNLDMAPDVVKVPRVTGSGPQTGEERGAASIAMERQVSECARSGAERKSKARRRGDISRSSSFLTPLVVDDTQEIRVDAPEHLRTRGEGLLGRRWMVF